MCLQSTCDPTGSGMFSQSCQWTQPLVTHVWWLMYQNRTNQWLEIASHPVDILQRALLRFVRDELTLHPGYYHLTCIAYCLRHAIYRSWYTLDTSTAMDAEELYEIICSTNTKLYEIILRPPNWFQNHDQAFQPLHEPDSMCSVGCAEPNLRTYFRWWCLRLTEETGLFMRLTQSDRSAFDSLTTWQKTRC